MSAATAVTELIQNLVRGILRDPAEAEAYSENPSEYLAAHGVADHDLTEVDIRPIIVEAAKECDLPEPSMALIDNYAKGEPAPAAAAAPGPPPAQASSAPSGPAHRAEEAAAPPPPARAVEPPPAEAPAGITPLQSIEQHLSYVTYVTYETNTSVVQNLIDNSTVIDNSSNVSFEVGGSVYGDIDMTNEVTNTNATGDGSVAVGGDMVGSNVNTGSGDINDVGTINANDSAVAVGGDATNTQDRSVDNSSTDNSVDNSTNVNVQDSFNDDSTNVEINDSFNTDNSRNTNVEVNDSFNDNSSIDNSVDSSINVDVALGGGRTGDPVPSGDRLEDPGFGRGETGTGTDRSSADEATGMPGTRVGTQEQFDAKYTSSNLTETPELDAAPMVAEQPLDAVPPTNEAPVERADDLDVMD